MPRLHLFNEAPLNWKPSPANLVFHSHSYWLRATTQWHLLFHDSNNGNCGAQERVADATQLPDEPGLQPHAVRIPNTRLLEAALDLSSQSFGGVEGQLRPRM